MKGSLTQIFFLSVYAQLSSGEFVGMVADNPDQTIKLKTFHCEIINDHEAINREERNYQELPNIRNVSSIEVQNNYITIKNDVTAIIENEMERIKNDPDLTHLLFVKQNKGTDK